jgi:hypothetical protein
MQKQLPPRLVDPIEWPASTSERRKILEWLVNFMQAKIEELSPLERDKMALEAEWWLRFFEVRLWPGRNLPGYWEEVNNYQKVIRREMQRTLPNADDKGVHQSKALISYHLDCSGKSYNLEMQPHLPKFDDSFRFLFFRLLEGMPTTTIQKCSSCDKVFVNPSRRRRLFCSSRCMWRFNAEKRRKKDPEGYRARQREIMKERYEKKQKAKGYKKVTHYNTKKEG